MPQDDLFKTSNMPLRLTRWQPSDWPVAAGWENVVADFLSSKVGLSLVQSIQNRIDAGAVIYPPTPFKALELTPLDRVRVVILGQDPYHGAGQAEGLAFSVAPGVKIPPSLRNIFKEIEREFPQWMAADRQNGSLVRWAEQGVLLLNTCLTVEEGQAASHAKIGWEALTDALISLVAQRHKKVVFMLWGAHAQSKRALLQTETSPVNNHLVLCANHPSPLSALRSPTPFLGCGHFKCANAYLYDMGCQPINW